MGVASGLAGLVWLVWFWQDQFPGATYGPACLIDVLTIIILITDVHTLIPFHYLEILCAFSKVLLKVSNN